jgi:hypothetical protein
VSLWAHAAHACSFGKRVSYNSFEVQTVPLPFSPCPRFLFPLGLIDFGNSFFPSCILRNIRLDLTRHSLGALLFWPQHNSDRADVIVCHGVLQCALAVHHAADC